MLIRCTAAATCVFSLALVAPDVARAQAAGRLHGTIVDETNAMTLPTAPIEVIGTDILVRSDLDGSTLRESAFRHRDFNIARLGWAVWLSIAVTAAAVTYVFASPYAHDLFRQFPEAPDDGQGPAKPE